MLLIRDQQLEAFGSAARERFERDLAAHLVEFFPRHTEFLGEKQLREVVRHGIAGARNHDIRNDYQTFLYVDLMFMLGSEFDRDLQLPWVAALLDRSNGQELQRIEALHSRAMGYLDAVTGENNEHWVKAMVRARDFEISQAPEMPVSAWAIESERILAKLYPEKCRYQGKALMGQFIDAGIALATGYGMTRFSEVFSYLGHAFFMGMGFERDPLYPWTAALTGQSQSDVGRRMEAVHAGTLDYLKFALAV